MSRRTRFLIIALSLLSTGSSFANSDSLGTWLEDDVVPNLAEVLTQHPRFKGETIRLATFRDGRPSLATTGLADAVQRKLRRELIAHQGVRIASNDRPHCRGQGAAYVLGVEVMRSTSPNHRVDIAVLDTNDAVWVGGVSYSWRGRLSTKEKESYDRRHRQTTPGSFDQPLDLDTSEAVVDALLAQVQCQTVHLGSVYIAPVDDAALASVRSRLIDKLTVRSLVEVSYDETDADARLMLALEPLVDRHRLVLKTVDDADRAFERASLYVRASPLTARNRRPGPTIENRVPLEDHGPAGYADQSGTVDHGDDAQTEVADTRRRHADDDAEPPRSPRGSRRPDSGLAAGAFAWTDGGFDTDAPYDVMPPLHEPIGELRKNGTCRGRSGRRCTALELEVHESVRVLTFHTVGGTVRTDCDVRRPRLGRNDREYQIESLPGTNLSFYALATRSARIARDLNEFIRRAPGSCQTQDAPGRWLARFDEYLTTHDESIFWRQVDIATN